MAAKPSIPKGTRDFSPVEMANRDSIDGDAFYTDGEIWR